MVRIGKRRHVFGEMPSFEGIGKIGHSYRKKMVMAQMMRSGGTNTEGVK